MIQSLRHQIGGLVEVTPDGGKVSRAAAAVPILESGNWFLPHPRLADWVGPFIHELATFPTGAFDDWVDAWSQGAKRLIHVRQKKPAPLVYRPYIPTSEKGWMSW